MSVMKFSWNSCLYLQCQLQNIWKVTPPYLKFSSSPRILCKPGNPHTSNTFNLQNWTPNSVQIYTRNHPWNYRPGSNYTKWLQELQLEAETTQFKARISRISTEVKQLHATQVGTWLRGAGERGQVARRGKLPSGQVLSMPKHLVAPASGGRR